MVSRYATATAFRLALEERLNRQAHSEGVDIMRLRRMVAFERLLARLFAGENPPWLLKGGYSLELRLHGRARATKDIDLTIPNLIVVGGQSADQTDAIHERLQDASELDLGDWFRFRISAATEDIEAAPYGGARFPVEALLAGRLFVRFRVDVAVGDAVVSAPEQLTGHHLLDFAGIPPVLVAALPKDQHFAEKIHSYSLIRAEGINTRVKDLIDLMLLIKAVLPVPQLVARALHATFDRRKTHPIPRILPRPPEAWEAQFAALATECGLDVLSLDDAYKFVLEYWATLGL